MESPKYQTLLLLCPEQKIKPFTEEERIFWVKLHPHPSKLAELGHSGCRDESHPACCFLTSYLGSTLARRKSWQPRPAGITSLSFLNVFQHFSWIPRSVCSLELPDSVRLCASLLRMWSKFTIKLGFTASPTMKVQENRKRPGLSERSIFCLRFTGHLCLTRHIINEWKILHAAQQAPIINQPGKSICGRPATNKSMQGKSCSCSLLLVSGSAPPQTCLVDLEKLDICKQYGSCGHAPTCPNFPFSPTQKSTVQGHF